MKSERLFDEIRDDRVLQEHSEITCRAEFGSALTEDEQLQFREIVDSWALLGRFSAMPDHRVFEALGSRGHRDGESRKSVFLDGLMKYYGWIRMDGGAAEWELDLGLIDSQWLEILLNCLEAYHVRVAPISKVELKASW